jgi:hypothetical protein
MRAIAAFALLLIGFSRVQPTTDLPDVWRGVWFVSGGSDRRLERVAVDQRTIRIRWRGEAIDCARLAEPVHAPSLVSTVFECVTSVGALQLALTSGAEAAPALLVHITVPGERGMFAVVMERGVTAAPDPEPVGAMPEFPWPPPRWTTRAVLPSGLAVRGEGEPLGSIFDRLRDALRRAEILEWSVYAIGLDGFAIVSRMESIDEEGRPQRERWGLNAARPRLFSIADYLSALFRASPGRYRVIALAVTARAVTASADPVDRETLERLLRAGAGDLSGTLRQTPLPQSGRCEALIYEFFRPSADDQATLVTASGVSAARHLAGAGLWRLEDLSR